MMRHDLSWHGKHASCTVGVRHASGMQACIADSPVIAAALHARVPGQTRRRPRSPVSGASGARVGAAVVAARARGATAGRSGCPG